MIEQCGSQSGSAVEMNTVCHHLESRRTCAWGCREHAVGGGGGGGGVRGVEASRGVRGVEASNGLVMG